MRNVQTSGAQAAQAGGHRRLDRSGTSDHYNAQQDVTVLLIRSHHVGWGGVRETLRARRDVRIVGEATQADQALDAALALDPGVIFAPAELAGAPTLALVTQVRLRCPRSKVLVLGEDLDHDALMALMEVGITGYLVWQSLSTDTISHCLDTIIEADLLIASPAVVGAVLKGSERRQRPRVNGLVLTPRERAVLTRLAEGLSQEEIAAAEHLSAATVGRATAALRDKFAAPSTFALGVQAALYGFVS